MLFSRECVIGRFGITQFFSSCLMPTYSLRWWRTFRTLDKCSMLTITLLCGLISDLPSSTVILNIKHDSYYYRKYIFLLDLFHEYKKNVFFSFPRRQSFQFQYIYRMFQKDSKNKKDYCIHRYKQYLV